MAEAKQQEKISGLTEDWLLVNKDELDGLGNTSEQGTQEIVAEKINQSLDAEYNASIPKLEAELTKVEEKQEVNENAPVPKENDVTSEQKEEASQEIEEKREPLENASTAEENSADPIPETEQVHEVEEKEETIEDTPIIKIETAPADFRFPTTNQTRHCFTRYIEYHRCINAKGEGAVECQKFAKYYRSLCPGEWVERWNEQRENGTFPGPL